MFAFLDLIPKWLWITVVLSLSALTVVLKMDNSRLEIKVSKAEKATAIAELQTSVVREEHMALVAQAEAALANEQAKARRTEKELQTAMEEERKKFHETTAVIAAARDDLRVRFQSLSARYAVATSGDQASGTSSTPIPGQAPGLSVAPKLSDPIGEIIDEAARAETIRKALVGCYASYDTAQAKLAATVSPVTTP